MELHRLAIAVVALMLAATMAVAAGRIVSGGGGSSNVPTPSRSDQAPVLRLGTPREVGAPPPPLLLSQPTPPATVTPRARQHQPSQESNASDSVSGGVG